MSAENRDSVSQIVAELREAAAGGDPGLAPLLSAAASLLERSAPTDPTKPKHGETLGDWLLRVAAGETPYKFTGVGDLAEAMNLWVAYEGCHYEEFESTNCPVCKRLRERFPR